MRIKPPIKVLVAHPGTQHSFHLAAQLYRNGLLFRIWTGFAIAKNSNLGYFCGFLPSFLRRKIANRLIENISSDKLRTTLLIEWIAQVQLAISRSREGIYFQRNKKFQEAVSNADIMSCDVVVGFDTSSWILADQCKRMNKKFILEVSIGHPISKERIYNKLTLEYPLWKEQIFTKSEVLIEKEKLEMELADRIVVPSEFVLQTYVENGIQASLISINPFGTTISDFVASSKSLEGKIKFLFFGALSARKGLPLLLDAWKEVTSLDIELTIAGYGAIPPGVVLPINVVNLGTILGNERQALFDNANVFVFPSYFEGFALVQIEAAACGLPIIATFNSGSSALIEHGETGLIIEAGDKNGLVSAIRFFVEHSNRIEEMGLKSRKRAVDLNWEAYGERWRNIINEIYE